MDKYAVFREAKTHLKTKRHSDGNDASQDARRVWYRLQNHFMGHDK